MCWFVHCAVLPNSEMGKSKDQRRTEKIDFVDTSPVRVGYMDRLIEVNRKYVQVPVEAEMTEKLTNWMTFEKDMYYPVGGLDSQGQPCKMVDDMVMTVEWMPPTKDICRAEFRCQPLTNVYWFRAIRFHAPGSMTVSFSVPNQKGKTPIKPLRVVVNVHRTGGTYQINTKYNLNHRLCTNRNTYTN